MPNLETSTLGECLTTAAALELSVLSHERHMLMANLTYMLSSTSEEEGDLGIRISSMWIVSTLISARHAELLAADGIIQRKMETLLQEDSNDLESSNFQFLVLSESGIQSWMQALERCFLNLSENWLLKISPNVIHSYPNMLTSGMLQKSLLTVDQLEETHGFNLMHALNLSDGCRTLMKELMDNLVSMPPSLGSSRNHGGPSGGLRLLSLAFARLTDPRQKQIPCHLWGVTSWKEHFRQKRG